MIKYHNTTNGISIAEIMPGSYKIKNPEEWLDMLAEAGYNNSIGLIVHKNSINDEFFDLKTGLAGEILQKFSNYRMKLAIIGDFSNIKSKSLMDFIRESNTRGIINFVKSLDEALSRLNKIKNSEK
jgi:hypothetical protein